MLRCVNKRELGLALLTVLIFLQAIAILGLYAVESAILSEKMSRSVWQKNIIMMAAEQALQDSELNLLSGEANCLIPLTPQGELIKKSLSWWQSGIACSGHLSVYDYYYVVEDLCLDACAVIEDGTQEKNIAKYYRVTLFIVDKQGISREMLQSTIIRPDKTHKKCEETYHQVKAGRQMWREVR
jgi:Tfp pilus assembly protein PilX